jgi:hypothetical protein
VAAGAVCAAALNVMIGSDVAMRPAARAAARSRFGMILSRWFFRRFAGYNPVPGFNYL